MDGPLTPLDGMTPIVLADLMLTAPLRRRANLVVLQPSGSRYMLLVKRGSLNVGAFDMPSDVGNAVVARLARMARIDPVPPAGSLPGEHVGVFKVRAGQDAGQFQVSFGVSPQG